MQAMKKNRARIKQAWTIAKIELRRAFSSKRAFWVYGLALFPSIIFIGNAVQLKIRRGSLSTQGFVGPALVETIQTGETAEAVIRRLGKAPVERRWESRNRVRVQGDTKGITAVQIEPAYRARFVRLNILWATYTGDPTARIYEFEVYGDDPSKNLALNRPATGSTPCSADEGPEKAFNGSVSGGRSDRWCSREPTRFLQVDLGSVVALKRIVIKHASTGGESEELDTRLFTVQAGTDGKIFATIVSQRDSRFAEEITSQRRLTYFDGIREIRLQFVDNKLVSREIRPLMNFAEDRRTFAAVFQLFYLRLAIFFGCLGIFMNLFRGEMMDKTLHFWFLVPARREVLLAGKYGAGLIASTIIFGGGALLCFAALMWTHNPVEVQAYWQSAGMTHAFWYVASAALGCLGYGSVFLAAGLLMRNPIIPAAVLLGWESINNFLPEILQKLSVLYYLQSLCPVPVPTDNDMPALLQLLLAPAAPASRVGAVVGLLAVTALVLWIARFAIRRMEISYGTE
jgi:hypothetical protein